jgi:hypothetical protein
MGVYAGPDIVEDGLILHLDAANGRSYPNTGTGWFDLSGNNNHFQLFNSIRLRLRFHLYVRSL